MTDPIVDEVREIRAKIAAEGAYDLRKIDALACRRAEAIPGLIFATPEELRARQPMPNAATIEAVE